MAESCIYHHKLANNLLFIATTSKKGIYCSSKATWIKQGSLRENKQDDPDFSGLSNLIQTDSVICCGIGFNENNDGYKSYQLIDYNGNELWKFFSSGNSFYGYIFPVVDGFVKEIEVEFKGSDIVNSSNETIITAKASNYIKNIVEIRISYGKKFYVN